MINVLNFNSTKQYIVAPKRRASSTAMSGVLGAIVGDMLAPYVMGLAMDWMHYSVIAEDAYYCEHLEDKFATVVFGDKNVTRCEISKEFHSMKYPMMSCIAFAMFGAICYFAMIFTVLDDKRKASQLPDDLEQDSEMAKDHPGQDDMEVNENDENLRLFADKNVENPAFND